MKQCLFGSSKTRINIPGDEKRSSLRYFPLNPGCSTSGIRDPDVSWFIIISISLGKISSPVQGGPLLNSL